MGTEQFIYIFFIMKNLFSYFCYYWFARIALYWTYANEHLRYQYISCIVDVNHIMLEEVVIFWCLLACTHKNWYFILLYIVRHSLSFNKSKSTGTLWPFHVIRDHRESIIFRQTLLWRTVGCKWMKGRLDWHTWLQIYRRKQMKNVINKLFLRLGIFV